MSRVALLVFPHQLFAEHPGLQAGVDTVSVVEDNLFFGDPLHTNRFHKQKLWFHRASMKRHAATLAGTGTPVTYVDHRPTGGTLFSHLRAFAADGGTGVVLADPHDDLLLRRIRRIGQALSLTVRLTPTPLFLNTPDDNAAYREGRRRWFMADFYKHQRRRLGLLMDGDAPRGGQWSFDKDNRKKVPRSLLGSVPRLPTVSRDPIDLEARNHVRSHYPDNPGSLDQLIYPTSPETARQWLAVFLEERFALFGAYEDAIVSGENTLWHSVLTPMLNTGLLTPATVVDAAVQGAADHGVPLNSLEGFLRQVIGWREFMRATYTDLGVTMRTTNHWGHTRPMPPQFYDGTTGIPPVDDAIHRVLETGYCHHIERLMVLGGFFFLCEIRPDDIYRWFMEMFVDSYDWVMVPNVYAMSQHADGGLITTKPYFSGSAYVRKMSNHAAGDWTAVWDGLYWRWILDHADELARNPRWAMMCAMARKMKPDKVQEHRANAEAFLQALDAAGGDTP